MGKARYHYLQLNLPFTVVSAARPYNDMLPVLRLSDAGPAGAGPGGGKYNAESPKKGSKRSVRNDDGFCPCSSY